METLDLEDDLGEIQTLNRTEDEGEIAGLIEANEPSLLHARKDPWYENKSEFPVHRQMIELAGQGFTVKEIAAMVGKTPQNVNNILRQKPLQQHLVNEVHRKVTEDQKVLDLVRNNVVMAMGVFVEIAGNEKCKPADRIAAAKELIDRRYGKTNQPINRTNDVDLNSLSDEELLQRRGN